MNRTFTTREKTLLVILAILLIGCIYYLFVFSPSVNMMNNADRQYENVQNDILVQQAVASKKASLEQQLEDAKAKGASEKTMPAYDNTKNEITLLNGILSPAASYNINFADAEFTDNVARRTVHISFTANSFAEAQSMISSLINSPYRCLIGDFSLTGSSLTQSSTEQVSVTVDVTFFESMAS